MPEYDFFATVREELHQLRLELDTAGAHEAVQALVQQLRIPADEALAVLWRASKRHGETLAVFGHELASQLERETARQEGESQVLRPATA